MLELGHRELGVRGRNVSYAHPWCHDPSHGGSYMDEGTFRIRIGLLPYVVPGDYLASSSMSPSLFARAYPMSDDPGLY